MSNEACCCGANLTSDIAFCGDDWTHVSRLWGIYSLFQETSGDTFGRNFAVPNYGMLYTAKGIAALLVPFDSMIREMTGNRVTALYVPAAANMFAALIALFLLNPLRSRVIKRSMAAKAAERLGAANSRIDAQARLSNRYPARYQRVIVRIRGTILLG